MLGKAFEITLRLAMHIQALSVAVKFLETIPESKLENLTEELDEKITKRVQNSTPTDFIVNAVTLEHGIKLGEYFNTMKLALANYKFNAKLPFKQIIQKLLRDINNRPSVCGVFVGESKDTVKICKKILYHHAMSMMPKDVADGNFKAPLVKQAMSLLAQIGLGDVVEHCSSNRAKTLLFTKASFEVVSTNAGIGRHVTNLGLDLVDFLENLKHCEEREEQQGPGTESEDDDAENSVIQSGGNSASRNCYSSGYDSHDNMSYRAATARNSDITNKLGPKEKRRLNGESSESSKRIRKAVHRPILQNKTNNLPYKLPEESNLMKAGFQRTNNQTVIDTSLTMEAEGTLSLVLYSLYILTRGYSKNKFCKYMSKNFYFGQKRPPTPHFFLSHRKT